MSTPRAFIDDDGQLLFVHDCNALCGDGETRLLTDRTYVLGVPPWAIASTEPLTITPSIDCQACPLHGFITNGEWSDAA